MKGLRETIGGGTCLLLSSRHGSALEKTTLYCKVTWKTTTYGQKHCSSHFIDTKAIHIDCFWKKIPWNMVSISIDFTLPFPALFCQYLWQLTRLAWKRKKVNPFHIRRKQNSINNVAWVNMGPCREKNIVKETWFLHQKSVTWREIWVDNCKFPIMNT